MQLLIYLQFFSLQQYEQQAQIFSNLVINYDKLDQN